MPWLTPDSIPEDDDCRPLSIPADSVWLALVSGALTELTQSYNWQQFGALTVQETVDKMQEILEGYYAGGCGCTLPGGAKPLRILQDGTLQELGDDGEWGTPTGDYFIPPPDARTEGTEPDQNCLAAKNAVNVLHTLYQSLSDSFAAELSQDEALTAFIGAAVSAVGFEFAPITFGIVIFMEVVFQALYQALAYLTADLWDDAVSNQIICFLVECAVNTDGVVTFDGQCFLDNLNSLTDSFGLSEVQLRLYLQIAYLMYFIGGIDGLNLAGRTTAITDDNCDMCNEVWCYQFDDANRLSEWVAENFGGATATYSSAEWHSADTGATQALWISWTLMDAILFTDAAIITDDSSGLNRSIFLNGDGTAFSGTVVWTNGALVGGALPLNTYRIDIYLVQAFNETPRSLSAVQFSGEGTNPFGDNNC